MGSWILLLLGTVIAGGAPPAAPGDRVAALEKTLLAPCCWSETIAVHRSPAALEMKKEVAAFVSQGKTDREILDYYKAKYGPRILIEPEGTSRVLANAIPWIVAAFGVLAFGVAIRHMLRRGPTLKPRAAGGALPDLPDDDW